MRAAWLCPHSELCGPVDANGCRLCVRCGSPVVVQLTERGFVLAVNAAYRSFGVEGDRFELPPDGLLED